MAATNSIDRAMVTNALARPSAAATATTMASRDQAVMSSSAAHVMVTAPRRVRFRPRSVRMRASTGKAVTLIEAPRNRENETKSPSCDPRREKITRASTTPLRKGTTMLTWLTIAAACPRPRMSRTSSSTPIRNMKSTSPNWARISMKGIISGPKRNSVAPGHRAPSSEGPRTIPAAISPHDLRLPVAPEQGTEEAGGEDDDRRCQEELPQHLVGVDGLLAPARLGTGGLGRLQA